MKYHAYVELIHVHDNLYTYILPIQIVLNKKSKYTGDHKIFERFPG